jgi:hypothetical protein
MNQLEEFIEEYNVLVIDDDTTGFYQIINAGTDEIWHTFACPADAQKVQTSISNLAQELPTGRHSIRVQAIGKSSKAIRGQMAQSVEGRSAAAKVAIGDHLSNAKAMKLQVDMMETQVASMTARYQTAQEQLAEASESRGAMMLDSFKLQEMVHGMLMKQEQGSLDTAERESRMRSLETIAQTLAPVLGQAIQIGSEFAEIWVKEKKAAMQDSIKKSKEAREAASNVSQTPTNE